MTQNLLLRNYPTDSVFYTFLIDIKNKLSIQYNEYKEKSSVPNVKECRIKSEKLK